MTPTLGNDRPGILFLLRGALQGASIGALTGLVDVGRALGSPNELVQPKDGVSVVLFYALWFAPAGTLPPLDVENPHVLRFRTFSKAYGMAGMRVGYALGHTDLIRAFDKIRNHFGVTRLGQQAAIAALSDTGHLHYVIAAVVSARARIAQIARDNGLTPLESATNFVTIDCGRDGAFAKRVLDGLVSRGVFVRMPGAAPLNRCIRITAGTSADLDIVAEELPAALKAAG